MSNPYQEHPEREAWEEGRSAGFFEGQQAERRDALVLVKALEKVLTTIQLCENNEDFGFSGYGLGNGGELALRAAKAYLNR